MDEFQPPFCANPACPHHHCGPSAPYTAFVPWGSYKTLAFGIVPRFRCSSCGKTFSRQTFRVDYWLKRVLDYDDLELRLASCSSIRAIGRAWGVAGKAVQNRIGRAARQALAFASRLASLRRPAEDLAADGFESFCVSQYFPNNIHLLVGSGSQFVYEADHATIRRKGRMTAFQRARRERLERLFRPPPGALVVSFGRVVAASLSVLSDGARPSFILWTDQKREYGRAIEASPCAGAMLEAGRIRHLTISSRAARTRENPLFPVNYLDRELRKDLHEHVRESTCFGRNVNSQMERLVLYLHYHNFRKRHRTRLPGTTHAGEAGYPLAEVAAGLGRLWKERAWLTRTELAESGRETWLRLRATPLKGTREYRAKHVAA